MFDIQVNVSYFALFQCSRAEQRSRWPLPVPTACNPWRSLVSLKSQPVMTTAHGLFQLSATDKCLDGITAIIIGSQNH